MRYKAEYAPSYLLDPEEYTWHLFDQCKPILDNFRYATFVHPEHSLERVFDGPGEVSACGISVLILIMSIILSRITAIPSCVMAQ